MATPGPLSPHGWARAAVATCQPITISAQLTTASRDWLARLYWPADGHFNPDGYRAYATIVATAIEPLLATA
jgi:lysophospholipase L1-like esterase